MQAFRVRKRTESLGGYLFLHVDDGIENPDDGRELLLLRIVGSRICVTYRDAEWLAQWHTAMGECGLLLWLPTLFQADSSTGGASQ